ncbi:glutathione S-transferase domain-containing protein [Luteimonas sp. SJ-92]|uniref:Glutathione S-transferase domain-containing protein n=1 Tax=Luteimonas salinisoli TaxID=2752307 RepID=A0A853J7H7_9GAMM|nr:glutathione S-transferase domain-containing protein [Luteimonas salinisoli]
MGIVGRSSSHFTRVTRIFAAELRVDYDFEVVPDLMATDAAAFGGNPALRLPVLRTPDGPWFGAISICRELWRRSAQRPAVAWPEDLDRPFAANAQELVLQAMSTEVALIMGAATGAGAGQRQAKLRASLLGSLAWLEEHATRALAMQPPRRAFGTLEVTLYCLLDHLEFREVLPLAPYPRLRGLRDGFGARPSAVATGYRFDR